MFGKLRAMMSAHSIRTQRAWEEPAGDQNCTPREVDVDDKIQFKNVKVQIEGGEKTNIPCKNK